MSQETYLRTTVYPFGKKKVSSRTETQARYIESIRESIITFGIGNAGVGKSYLAIAVALEMLHNKHCGRIVLTRPAVEAGEKLGFLPGNQEDKLLPYMYPLYDALDEFIGKVKRIAYLENGTIEIVPFSFMRGRTLSDAMIILDEAQNVTKTQMKMFLTRIGKHSRVVVNGDPTQIDLSDPYNSGLLDAVTRTTSVSGVNIIQFSNEDIQRSKIVREIVEVYK